MSIEFSRDGQKAFLETPTLCFDCQVLLVGDEFDNDEDTLAQMRLSECRKFARLSSRRHVDRVTCWRCSRPGEVRDTTWSDPYWPEFDFANPCLCDACVALLDLLPYGGALADEVARDQRFNIIAMLVQEQAREVDPLPLRPERQRSEELILAKLALLERDLHDVGQLAHGDDYDELAHGLGLSRAEAEAEVARMLRATPPRVRLRPREGTLVPALNGAGWNRVRELINARNRGERLECFRSRGLTKSLSELMDVSPLRALG
ncbi:MAG: hypothetical protein ACRDLE_02985 [Gaiellaceae bacterium]